MRIGLVVTLVVGLALALLGTTAVGGESRKKSTLRLSDTAPLALRGANFLPSERVRVTVTAGELRRTKQVTATRSGVFVVRFDAAYDRCSSAFIARAVGARGSQAGLKLPLPACPAP
jgi:hypothetical protein